MVTSADNKRKLGDQSPTPAQASADRDSNLSSKKRKPDDGPLDDRMLIDPPDEPTQPEAVSTTPTTSALETHTVNPVTQSPSKDGQPSSTDIDGGRTGEEDCALTLLKLSYHDKCYKTSKDDRQARHVSLNLNEFSDKTHGIKSESFHCK